MRVIIMRNEVMIGREKLGLNERNYNREPGYSRAVLRWR